MTVKLILSCIVALLALVNPVQKVLIVTTLQERFSPKELRYISIKSTITAAMILIFFLFLGEITFSYVFRVELYSFQITCGAVLMYNGLSGLLKGFFLKVDENIKIDYPKYNEVVDKFKNEIKLPITAYLSVDFEVKVSGVVDHKSVGDKQNIRLKIPLNQQAFKISKDYNKNVEKEIKKLTDKDLEIEMKKEICGTILIVVTISLFIVLYKDIFDIAKKNYYNTTLDKLLKDYGDVIVELNSEINKDGLQVVEVKNFNEMLDLEEELKIPIMFYEIEEDELGEFTINHNNIIYRYILKDEER